MPSAWACANTSVKVRSRRPGRRESDRACLTQLVGHAGAALGAATVDDLADCFRIPVTVAAPILPDTGLVPVRVQGWGPAWAAPDALPRTPRPHHAPVMLGPFDNLIWYRPRVQRLFDFNQVFEAYKPAHRRLHGYYVCPLANGRLLGRADLARRGDTLTIRSTSQEPHAGPDTTHHFAPAITELARTTGLTRPKLTGESMDPASRALSASQLGRPRAARLCCSRPTALAPRHGGACVTL
ncbi:winged helix DNA-binding domain-containing protein [Streptomyces sp. NBC_01116]|uniref:DNA glycosylase AlkZ-like family protein n=1 Tax=Streptomyces sp. NBC_01116 TaxID=2903752 RepID=UPI003252EF2E